VDIDFDGFGDDVRVDGQQNDEGRPLVREQHVHRVQDGQHLGPMLRF
jgi:hypothetical protein